MRGISPGLQSEVNLYRKYKDFEEAGWDIMSGVRMRTLSRLWPGVVTPPYLPRSSCTQVNILPSSEVTLYIADPAVVKVR